MLPFEFFWLLFYNTSSTFGNLKWNSMDTRGTISSPTIAKMNYKTFQSWFSHVTGKHQDFLYKHIFSHLNSLSSHVGD